MPHQGKPHNNPFLQPGNIDESGNVEINQSRSFKLRRPRSRNLIDPNQIIRPPSRDILTGQDQRFGGQAEQIEPLQGQDITPPSLEPSRIEPPRVDLLTRGQEDNLPGERIDVSPPSVDLLTRERPTEDRTEEEQQRRIRETGERADIARKRARAQESLLGQISAFGGSASEEIRDLVTDVAKSVPRLFEKERMEELEEVGIPSMIGAIEASVGNFIETVSGEGEPSVPSPLPAVNLFDNLMRVDSIRNEFKELGETIKNAGREDLERAREATRELGEPEDRPEEIARGITTNLPNLLGGMLVGGVSTVAGGPAAGPIALLTYSAALEGGFSYDEALRLGGSEEQADRIMFGVGAINGLLESHPAMNALQRAGIGRELKRGILRNIARNFQNASWTAVEEGVTESAQELINNAAQKTIDENQDLVQGIGEAGLIGFLTGGGVGGVTQLFGRARQAGIEEGGPEGGFAQIGPERMERFRELQEKDELTPEEQQELTELRDLRTAQQEEQIPQDLQPLAEEARQFDSAEEFVKAQLGRTRAGQEPKTVFNVRAEDGNIVRSVRGERPSIKEGQTLEAIEPTEQDFQEREQFIEEKERLTQIWQEQKEQNLIGHQPSDLDFVETEKELGRRDLPSYATERGVDVTNGREFVLDNGNRVAIQTRKGLELLGEGNLDVPNFAVKDQRQGDGTKFLVNLFQEHFSRGGETVSVSKAIEKSREFFNRLGFEFEEGGAGFSNKLTEQEFKQSEAFNQVKQREGVEGDVPLLPGEQTTVGQVTTEEGEVKEDTFLMFPGEESTPTRVTNIMQGLEEIRTRTDTVDRSKNLLGNILKVLNSRRARAFTKRETKAVQDTVVDVIDDSNLTLNDKAKFRKTITNIQTREDLIRELPTIQDRISRLEAQERYRNEKSRLEKNLKRTKPKKSGEKPVGKFTPEIQEIFDKLRENLKLNQDEAQERLNDNLEEFSNEVPPTEVSIENRLLAVLAGSDRVTAEDVESLNEDIESLIERGRAENELSSFNRNTEIQREKELVLDRVGRPDEGRATFGPEDMSTLDRIKQALKTFGNRWVFGWDGQMNILDWNSPVDNKVLEETFRVDDQENTYKQLQGDYGRQLIDEILNAYNIESTGNEMRDRFAANKKIRELTDEEINLGEFENRDGVTRELTLTRDEAIKRWMEFQDESLLPSFKHGNRMTEEMIEAIKDSLTEQDIAFARAQMRMYQEQYNRINEVYKRLYGINLPQNESYSPIKRRGFEVDVDDAFGQFLEEQNYRNAVTSGSLKSRQGSILPIEQRGSLEVLDRHFGEMNYFIAWAEKVRELHEVFNDPEVREAITEEFGSDFRQSLQNTIADFASNGQNRARRNKAVDFFRKSFTVGQLMIKPAIMIKQLTSTFAYLEVLSPRELATGMADFMKNPIENARTMSEESAFFRERGSNIERDIRLAMNSEAFNRFKRKQSWINFLMMNVQIGDKGAIAMGSWALRRKMLSEGASVEEAVQRYEQFGNETQQSSDISKLSEVQRGTPLEKLVTMFKTTPNQYFRKEVRAITSLFQEGGVSRQNLKKVGRTIMIYHFLLPLIFQTVAAFGRPDDDQLKRSAILGSLNGWFLVGDVIDSVLRSVLGMRVWDLELPVVGIGQEVGRLILEDIPEAIDTMDNEEIFEAIESLAESGSNLGIPSEQAFDISKGVSELMEGNVEKGIGLILGWSDFALQRAGIGEDQEGAKFKPTGGEGLTPTSGGQLTPTGGGQLTPTPTGQLTPTQ